MTDDPRIVLGHLVFELQDAVLSQGFDWDREWVVNLLSEAGLMTEGPRAFYPLSPLASECVDLYLSSRRGEAVDD